MVPSLGRTVLYMLTEGDVAAINDRQRRIDTMPASTAATALLPNHNALRPGQVYPAVIVRVWGEPPTENAAVNLQVLLDGDHAYWATSRSQGDEPGQWHEPPRV